MTGTDPKPAEGGPTEEDTREPFGLEEAYAVETPDDSRRLYAKWAATFESGFTGPRGYLYHDNVAAAFLAAAADVDGGADRPVLDVGCGTGLVGQALHDRGVETIDGIDISPEMLDQARRKGAYRTLVEADLTQPLQIESHTYAGIVSAGTFTHGHLPPDPLDELIRIAAPGAHAAIGVNQAHFVEHGFAAWFDAAVAAGRIGPCTIVAAPVYEGSDPDNPDDMSNIVVFEVLEPDPRGQDALKNPEPGEDT